MGPPVVAGELTQEVARRRKRQEERCSAHVLGAIHLPTGAVERMRTWREGIDRQLHGASSAFWGYVVRPPMRPKIDQKTKRIRFWRFSCAGFVLACYRAGLGSKVVITKETRLPLVYLDVLRDAYGEVDEDARSGALAAMGLGGYCLLATLLGLWESRIWQTGPICQERCRRRTFRREARS